MGMKIIDGANAVLGRIASYATKEALKGEDVVVVNCEKIIITGNKESSQKRFRESRTKVGSAQKGPKISRPPHAIVKRAIRGMLPDHRKGRGRQAFKKIRCYKGLPKEFEEKNKMKFENKSKIKNIKIGELNGNY